jgi:hypothetical protein
MKTSTAVISGIAALALIGGGTAYALSRAEQPAPVETPAAVSTETPAPTDGATPEPAVTRPTPTPFTTPPETVAPIPGPTYSAEEDEYLDGAHQLVPEELGFSDDLLVAAGHEICQQHGSGLALEEISVLDGLARASHDDLNLLATTLLC